MAETKTVEVTEKQGNWLDSVFNYLDRGVDIYGNLISKESQATIEETNALTSQQVAQANASAQQEDTINIAGVTIGVGTALLSVAIIVGIAVIAKRK